MVSASLGWLISDHLEANNDFCTSCHLAPGRPLHADLRRDFDGRPPATLAAAHGSAPILRSGFLSRDVSAVPPGGDAAASGRPGAATDSPAFRCIDCHGGASFVGRVRVKALAARDAFWYAVGDFEEPSGMRWPLWDEDCLRCHARFDETNVEEWQSPRFHQLPVHNAALGVTCVECHLAHELGGNPDAQFVHAPRVRAQCARCHPKFEEGME